MTKKEVRTKYIKSLVEDKNQLGKILEESTKETLDSLLEEKVNHQLRQMLSESDDSYEEEEVNPEEPLLDDEEPEETDSEETIDLESGEDDECEDGTCDTETEGDVEWENFEDCKDAEGEYDLRGKDINTVLKIIQSMETDDAIRIIKNDDNTATVEGNGEDFEIELSGDENDDFEDDSAAEFELEIDNSDDEDGDTEFDLEFDDEEEGDDDEVEFEIETEEGDENDEEDEIFEGKVDLGYTDNYQKKTVMTLPSDKDDSDSRFDNGAPKGGSNNKKRWVGTQGANGGNPYTQKTKQPMDEMEECGNSPIFEVELDDEEIMETHTRGMARKHNSVGRVEVPNTSWQEDEADTRNVYVGAKQKRNTSRATNESREIQNIKRKANAILAENKELKEIAQQIKEKLNEAVIINSSLAKVVKLVTENSTTRDEKINILNRFNTVKSLNESRELYKTISNELKQSHSVNNNLLNNTLTETKGQNPNIIVETAMLNQSEDLKEILSLQERLMKL